MKGGSSGKKRQKINVKTSKAGLSLDGTEHFILYKLYICVLITI